MGTRRGQRIKKSNIVCKKTEETEKATRTRKIQGKKGEEDGRALEKRPKGDKA